MEQKIQTVLPRNIKSVMGSKTYILRFRQSDKDIFEDILGGRKIVETRAATSRFKNIKAGDVLVFVCGKERFEKKVKKSVIFKNISAMLEKYKIKDIMPRLSTREELEKAYYGFSGYKEKIKKFGLIALEFE